MHALVLKIISSQGEARPNERAGWGKNPGVQLYFHQKIRNCGDTKLMPQSAAWEIEGGQMKIREDTESEKI